MIVKHIFITLSRINLNNINRIGVIECLKKLMDSKIQVFIVEEPHKDGNTHLHILVILHKGLSKHTYKKTIISLFPEFKGWGIDVNGVRSLAFTCKYILKCVKNIKELFVFNSTQEEFFKLGGLKEILLYTSIARFKGTLEEWKSSRLINRESYYKNHKKVRLIWNDIQKDSILRLKTIRLNIEGRYKYDETYNISIEGVVLLLKTCQLMFTDHQWKQTNLIVLGAPNCGKTTFFKKLESSTEGKLFWCSTRAGDMRNFDNKNVGIILDDIFTKDSQWALPLLLKITGREGFVGDQKITRIVQIPAGTPVFIIRNYARLFTWSAPISARLLRLYIVNPVNWLGFRDLQFKALLDLGKIMISDLQDENPELFKEFSYLTDLSKMTIGLRDYIQYCYDQINPSTWDRWIKTQEWVKDFSHPWTVGEYFNSDRYDNFINPGE